MALAIAIVGLAAASFIVGMVTHAAMADARYWQEKEANLKKKGR